MVVRCRRRKGGRDDGRPTRTRQGKRLIGMREGMLHAVDRKGFCHVKKKMEQIDEFSSIGNNVCARNNRVRTSAARRLWRGADDYVDALVNSGRVLALLEDVKNTVTGRAS